MPGKPKGGKRSRRGKSSAVATKRELILKEEGQEYAQVTRMLGSCRLEAFCFDGKTRQCHIRGKMQKKAWINKDEYILVGLRDYQDDKADVIHKYRPEEVLDLKKRGEIPSRSVAADDHASESKADDEPFVFADL